MKIRIKKSIAYLDATGSLVELAPGTTVTDLPGDVEALILDGAVETVEAENATADSVPKRKDKKKATKKTAEGTTS